VHQLCLIALVCGAHAHDVHPTLKRREKKGFFSQHARDRTLVDYQPTDQCTRQRRRSGPDLRGIHQIYREKKQGDGETSTFPPVDELIRRALRRPAHGAAGLRRGKLKGALPPAAVRALLPPEQGRVGSGSGRGHGEVGGGRARGAPVSRTETGTGKWR